MPSIPPVEVTLHLLIFVSVSLLVFSVFRYPVPTEPPIHRRIAAAVGADVRNTAFEQPLFAPVMSLALATAQRFNISSVRASIRRNLNAAGNSNGYSVEEYIAICIVCGALMMGVGGLITIVLMGYLEPITILITGMLGFMAPILTLRSAARSRMLRISKQLPYTLDLVALTMAAGSTFQEAIETIIRDAPDDDFNQELRLVQAEITFGSSRAQALSNLAERIPLDSLRSIVGAVNQAELLGTPLATILKSQSGMLRMQRSVRAEKLAASASLRILLPLMLILIAVALIMMAPMAIRYYTTGTLS